MDPYRANSFRDQSHNGTIILKEWQDYMDGNRSEQRELEEQIGGLFWAHRDLQKEHHRLRRQHGTLTLKQRT